MERLNELKNIAYNLGSLQREKDHKNGVIKKQTKIPTNLKKLAEQINDDWDAKDLIESTLHKLWISGYSEYMEKIKEVEFNQPFRSCPSCHTTLPNNVFICLLNRNFATKKHCIDHQNFLVCTDCYTKYRKRLSIEIKFWSKIVIIWIKYGFKKILN